MAKEKPNPEGAQALAWRKRCGINRAQLAALTGYSVETIYDIERGLTRSHTPISHWVMKRYRMACAAVAAGVVFKWGEAKIVEDLAVKDKEPA